VGSFILCTLHPVLLGNQMKEDETGTACSLHGGVANAYRIFVWKPVGKRPLVRTRHGWEDTI
jgi:hypothetical protein